MKKINIFDLDGTLWRNPLDTPENRKAYEKATGIPWVLTKDMARQLTKKHKKPFTERRGWYGRKETMEPPLVPDPVPPEFYIDSVVQQFLASKADPEALTIVMTGRYKGLLPQVLRILGDGNLCLVENKISQSGEVFRTLVDPDVTLLLLGMIGPKPGKTPDSGTLPWKIDIIDQYLQVHEDCELLEIWEDRAEHRDSFQELNDLYEPEVVVHFVNEQVTIEGSNNDE